MATSRTSALLRWLAGAVLAAAYLTSASLTLGPGRLPLRPFFEGTAPPESYRWVTPPDGTTNSFDPTPGGGTIAFEKRRSVAGTIATPDRQFLIQIFEGSIRYQRGETQVDVQVEPIDPNTLAPPPDGLAYDSNAYAVTATYSGSGEPAEIAADSCPLDQDPKRCPTIVMRYAMGATDLFALNEGSWTSLDASPAPASLQVFADVPGLGTFVAAGQPVAAPGTNVRDILAVVLGVVAAIVATVAARWRWIQRRWRRWRKKRRKREHKNVGKRARGTPPKPKHAAKTHGKNKRRR